jgi:energy-coupling factor transporter ATP-binding protein EcfA2
MNLRLQPGSRCLLIGANGAGKTTLLKIIGGKHMIPKDEVLVLGRPPFHDTPLTTSGDLSYVGGNWTRDIAFAGNSIPLTVGLRDAGVSSARWFRGGMFASATSEGSQTPEPSTEALCRKPILVTAVHIISNWSTSGSRFSALLGFSTAAASSCIALLVCNTFHDAMALLLLPCARGWLGLDPQL